MRAAARTPFPAVPAGVARPAPRARAGDGGVGGEAKAEPNRRRPICGAPRAAGPGPAPPACWCMRLLRTGSLIRNPLGWESSGVVSAHRAARRLPRGGPLRAAARAIAPPPLHSHLGHHHHRLRPIPTARACVPEAAGCQPTVRIVLLDQMARGFWPGHACLPARAAGDGRRLLHPLAFSAPAHPPAHPTHTHTHAHCNSAKSNRKSRPGKGGTRFYRNVGLGFKTPKEVCCFFFFWLPRDRAALGRGGRGEVGARLCALFIAQGRRL
jgi:hypothetical protein